MPGFADGLEDFNLYALLGDVRDIPVAEDSHFTPPVENLVAPGVGSESPLPFDEIQSLPWTLSPGETEQPPYTASGMPIH